MVIPAGEVSSANIRWSPGSGSDAVAAYVKVSPSATAGDGSVNVQTSFCMTLVGPTRPIARMIRSSALEYAPCAWIRGGGAPFGCRFVHLGGPPTPLAFDRIQIPSFDEVCQPANR